MTDYDASTYGDRVADTYDEWFGQRDDTDAAVAFLADLTGPGPALELGIGTGRIALPLRARGLDVRGIDASAAMVAKLRAKPGGDVIPVTIADFAGVEVEGEYTLVFVVFNTFFGLLDQDAQVRCFANVAGRLVPGGRFVIDAFVPDPARFGDRGQRTSTIRVGVDDAQLALSVHHPAEQRVDSAHVQLTDGAIRFYPVRVRYAWPSELDLMARLAGLELEARWGGWEREPYTSASGRHVSVYARRPVR
jgi:SAM-dependent methyltransferase